MQLSSRRHRAVLVGGLGAALAALAFASPVLAQEPGTIAVRGAVYTERSTRVVQPMVDARIPTSVEGTLELHGLVDAITSASAATGRDTSWTEKRYEVGAGYAHVLGSLRLGGFGRYSTESDYQSVTGGLRGEIELFQKNTTIGLLVGRGHDTMDNQVSVADGAIGTPRREESLSTGIVSLSVAQVLSRTMTFVLTYDFLDSHGYHGNLYRLVFGGVVPVSERVPEDRYRHAVYTGVRGRLSGLHATWLVGYRFYADDWGIMGHTPEARWIQDLGQHAELRLRARLHTQDGASFYKDVYTRTDIDDPESFVTEDEKLGALDTQLLGARVATALALFGATGWLGESRIDVGVERYLQSTSFGDAWIVQAGYELPL